MAGGESKNFLVKRTGVVYALQFVNEVICYSRLIDTMRHVWQCQEGFGGRAEDEGAAGSVIVIKGFGAEKVPCAKQSPFPCVPDGEGEIAEEFGGTVLAPFLVSEKY